MKKFLERFKKLSLYGKIDQICRIAFCPYLLTVLWITLFNRIGQDTVILHNVPIFFEYKNLLSGDEQWFYFWQIVNNILMLMPFGFMLPILFRQCRSPFRTGLAAFLFSALIEWTQLCFALGIFEFDDIFNNTLGAAAGYALYAAMISLLKKYGKIRQKLQKKRRKKRKKRKKR